MTNKRDEFFALIETSNNAHDQYIAKRRALEKAVWEALEKNDPQPGEAWLVLLPWNRCPVGVGGKRRARFVLLPWYRSLKGVIPAIKTSTGWITDPAYLREPDADGGYLPESAVIPIRRAAEAPAPGDTE